MLYRQKFDTFIRRYDDVGYITSKSDFGDRVVDASGVSDIPAYESALEEGVPVWVRNYSADIPGFLAGVFFIIFFPISTGQMYPCPLPSRA
ncbi:MAG: hypothetical protein LBB47_07105 [Spirochaetaceae bacterium]|jgi:hypothetical protein|nr:hypothetical protein [Spirochaetaceae bacterium]